MNSTIMASRRALEKFSSSGSSRNQFSKSSAHFAYRLFCATSDTRGCEHTYIYIHPRYPAPYICIYTYRISPQALDPHLKVSPRVPPLRHNPPDQGNNCHAISGSCHQLGSPNPAGSHQDASYSFHVINKNKKCDGPDMSTKQKQNPAHLTNPRLELRPELCLGWEALALDAGPQKKEPRPWRWTPGGKGARETRGRIKRAPRTKT